MVFYIAITTAFYNMLIFLVKCSMGNVIRVSLRHDGLLGIRWLEYKILLQIIQVHSFIRIVNSSIK